MAGASIPLTPAVHQMIDIGPVAAVRAHDRRGRLPDHPRHGHEHVRAPARQRASRSARTPTGRSSWTPTTSRRSPRPPSRRRCCRSPRRTSTRSSRTRSSCSRRSSATRRSGVKLAINGLLSLTPDGNPIIGETPGGQGPLVGGRDLDQGGARASPRRVAEWMTNGEPEIDPHGSDIARFYDHHRTATAHRRPHDRGLQQDLRHRPPDGAVGLEPRRSGCRPLYDRERELGAEFFEAAGWERPYWYGSNERAARRVRRPGHAARGRVGVALVVADHQRRAPRDARPGRAWSTCRRSRSSTSPGRARSPYLERLCVNKVDVAVGPDRLHAAPQRRRRDPRRPHDHAARRTTGSGS